MKGTYFKVIKVIKQPTISRAILKNTIQTHATTTTTLITKSKGIETDVAIKALKALVAVGNRHRLGLSDHLIHLVPLVS